MIEQLRHYRLHVEFSEYTKSAKEPDGLSEYIDSQIKLYETEKVSDSITSQDYEEVPF